MQNPGQKVNHALVLLGKYHGSGKDTYFKPFIAAVGDATCRPFQATRWAAISTAITRSHICCINEMPHAHKRDIYEDMKPLLASPPELLRINEKRVPEYWIPNIINVMSTTNEPGAIALADDDRRFDVIQTRPAVALSGDELADRLKRAEYFTPLHRWLDAGGNGAVFGWLLRRDVSAFNPHQSPPRTQAKIEMTRAGARPGVDWAMDLVAAGGSLAQRELVSIVEIMDLARRGAEGAGTIVANWITPDDVSRGLTLSGWRKVARASIESRRHQIWARGRSPELLAKLPDKPWVSLLEEDRKRSSGSDF